MCSNKLQRIWLYHLLSFSDAVALLPGSATVKVPAFFVARQACDLALLFQKAATARHGDQMSGIWVDSFVMHVKSIKKGSTRFLYP